MRRLFRKKRLFLPVANNVFCRKIAKEPKHSRIYKCRCEVKINKLNPELPIHTSLTKEAYANKGLILVDDVLNSGTTLIYAIRHF
jgi:pyrimidine operon attenuation protein/uracil phosphoribosyltransferase